MKRTLLLLAVAAGCGDDISTAQVDAFIQSLATQSCDWEFRCCKDPEIATLDGHKFTDEAHCVPYRQLALENQLYIDRLAVGEGRLRLDGAKTAACLAQMTGRACNPGPG